MTEHVKDVGVNQKVVRKGFNMASANFAPNRNHGATTINEAEIRKVIMSVPVKSSDTAEPEADSDSGEGDNEDSDSDIDDKK